MDIYVTVIGIGVDFSVSHHNCVWAERLEKKSAILRGNRYATCHENIQLPECLMIS